MPVRVASGLTGISQIAAGVSHSWFHRCRYVPGGCRGDGWTDGGVPSAASAARGRGCRSALALHKKLFVY
jgi:hypothetical protein